MTENGFAIQTHSLTKRFGRLTALDGVSANVPTGSIYGLMGPNGAGKTTFVRVMLNLLSPTRGSATVLGHDVVREPVAVRRRIGHVAALQPLWEWMKVREFTHFMGACYPQWNPEAVSSILSHVGIDPEMKIQALSRGQRAIASLAAAIGHGPDLLLLDEALTGLDPMARREVLRNVIDAMHAQGRTVLITGQDIADMERICDHVGFLVKGRLVLESTLDDLKAKVKRVRVEHERDVEIELPQGALEAARTPGETSFTTADFSESLSGSLAGPNRRVEVRDMSLEDIFVHLAQAELRREAG
jgi:ABC-2 type transport system ATP-binding protein